MLDQEKFLVWAKLSDAKVYSGSFNDDEDVFQAFAVSKDDQKGIFVLFAIYDHEGYEGSAFVLFLKDGKLYEVNGSHCSCYGLEDQWSPEETSVAELMHRIEKGNLGYSYYDNDGYADDLKKLFQGALVFG